MLACDGMLSYALGVVYRRARYRNAMCPACSLTCLSHQLGALLIVSFTDSCLAAVQAVSTVFID